MTTLLSILAVIGIIALCYMIGKYNKNDNLFWVLVISLLAGMAGGAIARNAKREKSEKTNITTQVINPTQVLPANCIDFCAVLGSTLVVRHMPVGQDTEIPARDSSYESYALSKSSKEIRGQPSQFNPQNKGTPGMPFDTS
jgi:hypothetical protein